MADQGDIERVAEAIADVMEEMGAGKWIEEDLARGAIAALVADGWRRLTEEERRLLDDWVHRRSYPTGDPEDQALLRKLFTTKWSDG